MPTEVDDIVVMLSYCQESGQSINRQDDRCGSCGNGCVDVIGNCRCKCRRLVLSMRL